ncbi:hypothetical protein N0B16_03010 [Chryseobacterium sp. GMJ5]|uniref:YcxB-like protein domain-containing protein n=1 Tax=Chryseobacterium gilvum TaxID=2976534 RepID=A0ABT2VWW8_9FLAO|nr:hypothetical protein [Chryseobacterium gilvum]MCU7613397.1 hypothetical protein [Chryseobacterium gilvum]
MKHIRFPLLNLLFGSISFYVGIYFLKEVLLLSILFFIAALVSLTLAYKEYCIHKNQLRKIDTLPVAEEVQIRKSKLILLVKISSYFIFIIVSVFFLIVIIQNKIENLIVIGMMPLFIIVFVTVKVLIELKNMNAVSIFINSQGIKIQNGEMMNWGDIQQEKITSKVFRSKESKYDYAAEVEYLFFYFKNEKMEIALNELDLTTQDLNDYLKKFRERFDNEKLNLP